ncbi:MAG: hypothetical protein R3E67_02385 [Pseudomonadales bacterium]
MPETIEEFIPQMLNLQLQEGISFTKGCYTGQENCGAHAISRHFEKAMYRIGGRGTAPAPNTAVFQDGHAQAAGHIVCAENIADENWEALAVINHDAIAQKLRWKIYQRSRYCHSLTTYP